MKSRLPNVIAIVGPNAVGKSALAVGLAKIFGGEIISADSRQVYRGLDIGTGKIARRDMLGIPHHLLDVAEPRRQFSVAEFRSRAGAAIRAIGSRGKIPFVVGGSGFWVDALLSGLTIPEVAPNPRLRKRLEKKNAAELLALLRRLDPGRARSVDRQNPRRIIRAIEIARALGRVPKLTRHPPYRVLWLGVLLPPRALRKRIRARLRRRLRSGMIAEAKRLHAHRLSWRRFSELGLEYRFLADHLRGKVTRREMSRMLEAAIWRYARRQVAWFKRNPAIHWIESPAEARRLIRTFIAGRR